MDNYQQRVWWPVFLGCLLWIVPMVSAAAAANLFESEVVVSSQSPAERSSALHTALTEVLVRVAGRNNVLDTEPAVVGAL